MSDTDPGQGSPDALAAITAAAEGLLVPSESDHPFEPFRWPGPGPLTPEALVAHLGLPPGSPVETRAPGAFFAPLTAARDWHDAGQRATAARFAARFAALRATIDARLTDTVVYRVGRVQVAAIIVGRDPAGATVGLRATLIET